MTTSVYRSAAAMRSKRSAPVFLTLGEVAAALGVSRKTIIRRVQAGELHAHRIGRQLRVSQEDFASYLAARRC